MLENLEAAKLNAKASRDHVDRQKRIVAALTASGSDTAEAERILRALEVTQNSYLAEMMRALNALDDMPMDGSKPA